MDNRICAIVGAGFFNKENFHIPENAYVIAADGGFAYLEEAGIFPDMVIGDFDSLEKIPEHPNLLKCPVVKDDTDTMIAVKAGLEKGFRMFYIYGGTGGRFDHTLANIQILSYIAQNGGTGFLFGENYTMASLKNNKLCFCEGYTGIVSVFSHGSRAGGVNLRGLKYPLNDAAVTSEVPVGVSNSFTGACSEIEVGNGTLDVLWYDNTDKPLPEVKAIERR